MTQLKWAEKELELAGYHADDLEEGPNKWIREGTLKLLRVFNNQGYNGMSESFAVQLFIRLASHKPLSPLTGEDDEWDEIYEGIWQNKRATSIFKKRDGVAYDISGVIFWKWSTNRETGERYKVYFTNSNSRVTITFPYEVPDKPKYQEHKD